jgi:hypothetical protein
MFMYLSIDKDVNSQKTCVLAWSTHGFTSHSSFWGPQCFHSSLFIAWKSCACAILVSTYSSYLHFLQSYSLRSPNWSKATMPCKSCSTLAHNTELSWRATYSECKHDTVSAYLPVRSGSHWSCQSKKCKDQTSTKDTRLSLWPTEAKNLCSENPTDLVSRLAARPKWICNHK